MVLFRRLSTLIFLISILCNNESVGQQVPLNPISYRVFSPFIYNPAISGSKDFSSIDLIAAIRGSSKSQILSWNTRLAKKVPGYFLSPDLTEFSNTGIGGYIFNDLSDSARNLGFGATFSYHIPLDKKHLRFLSFAASAKGVKFKRDAVYSTDPAVSQFAKDVFYPNLDLGVYYYSPAFFAGVSFTNLLGNPEDPDNSGNYDIPVSLQYFIQAGYKILISRSMNIVLEPSVLINANGSSSKDADTKVEPMLKFYIENFCLGTYFNNSDKMSLFLQYKFPRFYFGTFFQLPKNSPYYKQAMVAEIALGINLTKFSGPNHW